MERLDPRSSLRIVDGEEEEEEGLLYYGFVGSEFLYKFYLWFGKGR